MTASKDDFDDIISLFRLYEQKMYHIAYAILHDSFQAEDAVMDAFVWNIITESKIRNLIHRRDL